MDIDHGESILFPRKLRHTYVDKLLVGLVGVLTGVVTSMIKDGLLEETT